MSPLLKKNTDVQSKLIRKYCIQSGIMAFCIMMFTYLCHSNTLLFGDNTVLRMDLYHQYGPLYSELYDRLTSGGSLIYSWTSGLGGGFLGNLFNYCCSPFAVVMLICGHKNMPEAIAIMIMLKAVFSAVSFTYYINKTNKSAEKISPAFGLLYAFCGYFVAYSWNIMWLDAMAIFPLVIYGIERIINEKKPGLFIFALTYTMITNYYMAFMVCILSVIYFLYYYFGNYELAAEMPKKNPAVIAASADNTVSDAAETAAPVKKRRSSLEILKSNRFFATGFVFAGGALLSFLLAAFALLPVVYSLKSSSATSSTFPDTLKVYFNFFDFIANHLPAVNTTIRSSGDIVLPNVYCGIITVLMLPFYFMSSKVSGKQKIAAAVVIGVFYLSFSINYLNYMWHGFHFPNDLPYRYSFAYSFILLTLVYKAIESYEEFTKKDFVVAGIALTAFIVFVDKLGSTNVEDKTIYLSLIFCIFYVVIFGLSRSPRYTKKTISTLLVFMIIVEICFCNTGNYIMSQSKKSYTSDYDDYQQISEAAEAGDERLFYRTELTKLRARMDPCWFGYNGMSTFSSMAYENTSALMKSLGFFGNKINSYTYYPQTPIINSYFALGYLYDNSHYLSENVNYTAVGSNDHFDAYRYNFPLPIAFGVSADVKDWNTSDLDPFAVQNDLVKKTTGISDVMKKIDADDIEVENLGYVSVDSVNNGITFFVDKTDKSAEATAKVIIDVEEAGDYYVYAGSTKLSRLKITADDFSFDYVSSSIQPITMGVGYQPAGAQIVVEYTVDKANASASLTFRAAQTDEQLFKSAYDKICADGLFEMTEFNESSFSGKINVAEDNSFIFTSIPYDESWQITVDGKTLKNYDAAIDKTDDGKIVAVGNGLIGFDVDAGEHEISFKYVPKGLKEGIILTVIGICILAAFIVLHFLRRKKNVDISEGKTLIEEPSAEELVFSDEIAAEAFDEIDEHTAVSNDTEAVGEHPTDDNTQDISEKTEDDHKPCE